MKLYEFEQIQEKRTAILWNEQRISTKIRTEPAIRRANLNVPLGTRRLGNIPLGNILVVEEGNNSHGLLVIGHEIDLWHPTSPKTPHIIPLWSLYSGQSVGSDLADTEHSLHIPKTWKVEGSKGGVHFTSLSDEISWVLPVEKAHTFYLDTPQMHQEQTSYMTKLEGKIQAERAYRLAALATLATVGTMGISTMDKNSWELFATVEQGGIMMATLLFITGKVLDADFSQEYTHIRNILMRGMDFEVGNFIREPQTVEA